MKKIKLVIWDLDETFWQGTLSEEGVCQIEENIILIKELTDRGIINSICSKNDFSEAKKTIIELKIWDYFIFPSISWLPKGEQVKSIIEKCQLRAENVLFLDDNHSNLEEVKYYCKNIYAELPSFIPQIVNHPSFVGKNDKSHTRLNQYKILEKKNIELNNFSNNIEFLKSCDINIEFVDIVEKHIDRVCELIERTNQLNFTKIRLSKSEIVDFLGDNSYEHQLVHVRDKFGDYGLAGFYSYNKAKHFLKHFVFSCRVLNIGIEQFLFDKLNYPNLEIVPKVAINLKNNYKPEWIKVVNNTPENSLIRKTEKTKIFFKGGCDLSQMLFYLNYYDFDIVEETNYVSSENIPIHNDHSQIVVDGFNISKEDKVRLSEKLPFIDSKTYDTKLLDFDYDFLIFSTLMDFTQVLYLEKKTGLRIPFGAYNNIIEDVDNVELNKLFSNYDIDDFKNRYKCLGQITAKEFKQNLRILRNKIPSRIPIIFINGSEVNEYFDNEEGATERHKVMNDALNDFINESKNCYLLDVRKQVFSKEHLIDNLRHYSRVAYKNLAMDLLDLLKINKERGKIRRVQFLKSYILRSKVVYRLKKIKTLREIYDKINKLNG